MRKAIIFAAMIGWFAHDGVQSQIACPTSAGSYAVTLIQASGSALCGTLDPYSFTITSGFIQIRTHFVENETPTGIVGNNPTFHLSGSPAPIGSLKIYRNGVKQDQSNFSVAGSLITFRPGSIPEPGDKLTADYRK